MLNEMTLIERLRDCPLIINPPKAPSTNRIIDDYCNSLINIPEVINAITPATFSGMEQNIDLKRQRAQSAEQYHQTMVNNVFFIFYENSYLLNIFRALKGDTIDPRTFDYGTFINMLKGDCKQRVINLDAEARANPDVTSLLQFYLNNDRSFPMPLLGTVSKIENDYIMLYTIYGCLNAIMRYVLSYGLQRTTDMLSKYLPHEISDTLYSFLLTAINLHIDAYARG